MKIPVDEIHSITKQLVAKLNPEKVILFGSSVQGKRFSKDLDFFIIKKDVPRRGIDRMQQVRRLIEKTVAADFIVVTPQELADRIAQEDPFILEILRSGKILYG